LRTIDARLAKQAEHLGGGPAVEGRRLHGNQHEIGREQRRAHEASDTRRPVDDDMIGGARDLRRFTVERVTREANDAEQPWDVLARPLLRPVER
jgi:hypothetical protein